ncbi:hypothetical protein D6833_07840, partial [Candidatus Parcubacteria bacterium]
SENLLRLPEVLQNSGHTCAAFSTIVQVSREVGFDYGFDAFYELFRGPEESAAYPLNTELAGLLPSSEDLNAALFPWIEEHADEDFFVLAWSIDTHVPYTVPLDRAEFVDEAFRREPLEIDYKSRYFSAEEMRLVKQLYESCIFYNDAQFGRLCGFLKDLNIYDDCLLVVLGDHGEVFDEHSDPRSRLGETINRLRKKGENQVLHRRRGHIVVPPYDEDIHVPLIFKFPQNRFAGTRSARLASLVDVSPTILGLASPESRVSQLGLDGKNLMPYLTEEAPPESEEVVFCSGKSYQGLPHYYCVRSPKWKYILTEVPMLSAGALARNGISYLASHLRNQFLLAKEALYDLQEGEDENVIKHYPEVAASMRAKLDAWRKRCKVNRYRQEKQLSLHEMDAVNERQLRALGYMK